MTIKIPIYRRVKSEAKRLRFFSGCIGGICHRWRERQDRQIPVRWSQP